jgi:hypothetical protein
MAKTVPMIGLQANELYWIRLLVLLLRHPDANVAELTRQALTYLAETAAKQALIQPAQKDAPCRIPKNF